MQYWTYRIQSITKVRRGWRVSWALRDGAGPQRSCPDRRGRAKCRRGWETMSKMINMSLEEVHSTTRALLEKQGFNEAHAQSIANTVTAAERDECRHHGLFRIPFYVNG